MTRRRVRAISALLASLCFVSGALAQADQSDLIAFFTGGRPNAEAGATDVQLSIFVIDIRQILDVEQVIVADFVLEARWSNPRLATSEPDGTMRSLAPGDAWHPQLSVLNLDSVSLQYPERIIVDDDGGCAIFQRYVGTLSVSLDLHRFPFDDQTLAIQVVAFGHTEDDVHLIVDDIAGRRDEFSVVDWRIGDATFATGPFRMRHGGVPMAGMRVSLPAERYANYYVFKVITPLIVILMMSWAVLWIDPKHVAPRIGLAATSLLTLIAYRFMLGTLVPKVSYLTRLDVFIFGATLMVLIAMIEALIAIRWAQGERASRATLLDKWSRVLAPASLAALLWLSFG